MSSARTLNTFAAPQWAAVVSGVAWKAYTLTPDGGAVSVEVMRAPVIVWAKTGGEEEAVKLTTTTPSLLDVRALEVNTAPHFERFRLAARGRVRHSVRWKSGARVQRKRVLATLDRVVYAAHAMKLRAEGRRGLMCWARHRPMTAKEIRQAMHGVEIERYHDRLRDIAPGPWEDESGNAANGWDEVRLSELDLVLRGLRVLPEDIDEVMKGHALNPADRKVMRDALALACLLKDRRALRAIASIVNARRASASLSVTLALRALEAAAYRAHLTRRVRPPVRRTRVRRPLYARPRPPTAPLAPPVA